MRKIALLLLVITCSCQIVLAQKFGYIDAQFILQKMPEYKEAMQDINKASVQWQKEVEDLNTELDKLRKSYKAEEILLTEEMKKERLDKIVAKEKEAKETQKKIFGFEGLLFLKRQELIKPVQDKLYEVVEKVAKKQKLQIIYDKSGALIMIYHDPRHDYTDYVLDELGLGDDSDVIDQKDKREKK